MNATRPPHVLVIAYDFPPHAAIGTMRTLRVVRRLHAAGWRVTVLTSDPASYLPTTPKDDALLAHVPPDVRVLRAGSIRWWDGAMEGLKGAARGGRPLPAGVASATSKTSPPSATSTGAPRRGGLRLLAQAKDVIDAALSIPDREIGWLVPAVWKGLRDVVRTGRPDIIYSSAPPWTGQLVALGMTRLLRRPWVADFRDPWSRAPWRGDRYRFAMRAAAVLERRVVRATDGIVFVAEGNRDDFAAHYGGDVATKFHVVPNGCDPAEFDALERPARNGDAPHVMLHAGSLYAGRTPVPVFKALARALDTGSIDRTRFRLQFLGINAVAGDLPRICSELGLADVVEFLPRVPRSESLKAMVTASSLLLLQPGHTVSVPGKVYEYLAAGRPIFALAEEGETAEVVRRSGLGISVTPENETSIVDGLVAVVGMSQGTVPQPPRALYDGNLGAATIEQLLRSAVTQTA